MKTLRNIAALTIAAAGIVAPLHAAAKTPDTVSCSVVLDYSINRVLRLPFSQSFTVAPGVDFDYDFSTATRFRYFQAKAEADATTGDTTVTINYYNDVGVFTFIELGTSVKVTNHKDVFTAVGKSTFFTSQGTAGEHTTDYELSCAVVR